MIRLMITLTLSIVLVGNIAADKFYFIVMGDNRGAKALEQPEVFKQIIREVNLLNPDLVIMVGDLIYGYTSDTGLIKREWRNFKHIVSELDAPYYLVEVTMTFGMRCHSRSIWKNVAPYTIRSTTRGATLSFWIQRSRGRSTI